jgi:gamma-glutamylcyclotransferase (GGCT)/AIG2-like uncharacterized protein YtfP
VRYSRAVPQRVFFYGTLMTGFDRRRRLGMDDRLLFRGRGSIDALLFDLGLYPAAVPASDSLVHGEVFEILDEGTLIAAIDEIEGYEAADPDASLYVRREVPVRLEDGTSVDAWVYFYNAPLGHAPRIESGDYRQHLRGGPQP